MIEPGNSVIVGFSGGADSTALLFCLYELRKILDIKIIAVHINHMIRKEAGNDSDFAESFCKERGIECIVKKIDVPRLSKEWKMTEEEAGRKVRYQAFEEVSKKTGASLIAIAHHQNDVAETLLMNLIRGSGLHGAGAIRPKRDNVIRPLLCVSRSEIEQYLSEKNQSFCHDATNDDNIHTRNIIRNVIIPVMEKDINTKTTEHLFRVATNFSRADEYIRKQAEKAYESSARIRDGQAEADLCVLRGFDNIIREEVILLILEKLTPHRKDITSAHVDFILSLTEDNNGTATADLPYGLVAIRSYNKLFIKNKDTKILQDKNKSVEIPNLMGIGDEVDIDIPKLGVAHIRILKYNGGKLFPTSAYTKWFDYDRIQRAIFRKKEPEDYILIENKTALFKKKIGKLLTDEKVPRQERENIILLADGNNVLWVPGVRMSGAYKISDRTERILEIQIDHGGIING
ncbi:tRNA lysidine(34) synthetase TilS [Butyrivibrio sp. YAB3001]|uniref:tRNA lysidine(34) synthetase TilS n=1 Tax=Butyrivibrio sp. YAB3001 TaxID=1520812 RepID=UPI0015881334|nr:tRNA lysidine(34) synthetase TilS [Butyrivibrio sp. YAB3001]